ncbi:unnamed protein product [Allacma fusca]|uniref:Uncharacterized protein n=1 Tax=Allacma fusca TaxID=39272 RepID=A0A8J2NZT6_9HEXA|nr:unnamed protein product [Allacma fusca]
MKVCREDEAQDIGKVPIKETAPEKIGFFHPVMTQGSKVSFINVRPSLELLPACPLTVATKLKGYFYNLRVIKRSKDQEYSPLQPNTKEEYVTSPQPDPLDTGFAFNESSPG